MVLWTQHIRPVSSLSHLLHQEISLNAEARYGPALQNHSPLLLFEIFLLIIKKLVNFIARKLNIAMSLL